MLVFIQKNWQLNSCLFCRQTRMAASVLPTNCKNQMKAVTKSPNVVRRNNARQYNAANRKSAVERLEESKANYVKSERVLDSKQELRSSSQLRINPGFGYDVLYKSPPQKSESTKSECLLDFKNCMPLRISPGYDLLLKASPPKAEIHKSANDCKVLKMDGLQLNNAANMSMFRARTKSHSECRDSKVLRKHSFASQSNRNRIEVLVDIESQLKRLISSGSKENISVATQPTTPARMPRLSNVELRSEVQRGYSDPTKRSGWVPPIDSLDVGIHKSMPDLSPLQLKVHSSSLSSADSVELLQRPPAEEGMHYATPKRLTVPLLCSKQECEEDLMPEPPRRFSNGTGVLHLTPYYSASCQLQRRPVSRSKSDVSHRYSKGGNAERRNNYTSAEIERFFDTMGLEASAWHRITAPSSVSSPPCFFQSVSSIDSNDGDSSGGESRDSTPVGEPREGLRDQDLRAHGPLETSVVEKNARVIKWLYSCRKAVDT